MLMCQRTWGRSLPFFFFLFFLSSAAFVPAWPRSHVSASAEYGKDAMCHPWSVLSGRLNVTPEHRGERTCIWGACVVYNLGNLGLSIVPISLAKASSTCPVDLEALNPDQWAAESISASFGLSRGGESKNSQAALDPFTHHSIFGLVFVISPGPLISSFGPRG
ncbi:hypothetical protein CGRA01v4_09257 [Colletotrichum graminicola]|nr:hypothetical protein CGRA01v4_09257 [Colletotrichum graminicola]